MDGFRDLVGTDVAPVSKKAAVKALFPTYYKNNMHCWDQYYLMKQGRRMIPWMNDEESK